MSTPWLRQSTAVTVKIGPFVDNADGDTEETGLTISQADVRLSKNGGNYAQKNESSACTHDELGEYDCALDATDTGTLGRLRLAVHESGALHVVKEFMVVPANVWDSLFGSDKLDVSVVQWLGTAPAALTDTDKVQASVQHDGLSLATAANQTTILARLGAWTGSGVNTVLGAFKALLSKGASAPSDIGGTFDPADDSVEALRDHVGDGSNLTEAGGDGDHLTEAGGTGDHLSAVPDTAGTTTLLTSRLTATRAGYLDNLNTGGLVASAADVAGITQAQRVRVIVPAALERPDSSSTTYRVWIYAYDEQHKAEDLDSNPTVTVENNAGTDRSSALGTVTKPSGTGIYYVDYTLDSGDAIEGLVFRITATEGGTDTEYAAATLVVDTTAVDFTAADRAKLDTLHDTRIPGVIQPQSGDAYGRLGAPAGASIAADIANVPTAAENRAEIDSNSTQLAAIKAKTDNLPADPADASDIAAAFGALNDLDATAIQAAANAALVALHLDHLLAVEYDPASKPGAADALLNELVENDGGVSRFTVNALEQAPVGGGGGGGLTMSTALPSTPTTGTAGDVLRSTLNFLIGKRTFEGDGVVPGSYGAYGYRLTIAQYDDDATAWAVFDVNHPTTPSIMVRVS